MTERSQVWKCDVCGNIVEVLHAGVGQLVYTSFSGQMDLDFPLRNAKRVVEQHLKESGLTYTILRPSFFDEVWLSPALGFDAAKREVAKKMRRGIKDSERKMRFIFDQRL